MMKLIFAVLICICTAVRLRLPTSISDSSKVIVPKFVPVFTRPEPVDPETSTEESMGDIEGRDEDLARRDEQARLKQAPVNMDELNKEGWVPDQLPSVEHNADWVPRETLKDLAALANYTDPFADVNDNLQHRLNETQMDPRGSPGPWRSVDNNSPSQDDPVRPEPVKYTWGLADIKKIKRIIYPRNGGIVRDDPLQLSEPPMELAQPPQSAFTRDIEVGARSEDNDMIGAPVRGFDAVLEGNLMDSGHTRSLDPTMPLEKMVHPGLAAVNDIAAGTTFGADEVSNLDPVPRPFEPEPVPLERVPFRDGMQEERFGK